MSDDDKEFLLIVIESMQKGQKVQIKKVKALHSEISKNKQNADTLQAQNNQTQSNLFSAQDRQNIT